MPPISIPILTTLRLGRLGSKPLHEQQELCAGRAAIWILFFTQGTLGHHE
jgi:hypothetical protein